MGFIHGKVTFVSLDGDDLSGFGTSCEFTRSADSHDVTTFGKDSHVKQGGLFDGSATIEGIYDNTESTGPRGVIEPLIGTNVELVHQPEGAGAGLPQDVCDVLVQEYTESSPVADMVTWSVSLELSDDVDTTAQSA